jgi:hypothetical protein
MTVEQMNRRGSIEFNPVLYGFYLEMLVFPKASRMGIGYSQKCVSGNSFKRNDEPYTKYSPATACSIPQCDLIPNFSHARLEST